MILNIHHKKEKTAINELESLFEDFSDIHLLNNYD